MKRMTWLLVVAGMAATTIGAWAQGATKPYQLNGQWIEGCACGVPCSCVMTGKAESGCEGVSVLSVRSGKYGDVNLAGAKMALGLQPGGWGIVYFDPATTQPQRDALQAIMAPEVKAFGLNIEATKTAPITISGTNGSFTVTIPDVMSLQTEPVMGLDKTRPIEHLNLPDPILKNCYQGRTTSGSFKDGGHEFTLKDTNAFWSNVRLKG